MKWVTYDLRTGQKRRVLPVKTGGRWEREINDAGSLRCAIPMTLESARLNLRESTRPARTFLSCEDGDRVLQAGPIWGRRYDADRGELVLSASGAWSVWDHRLVMKAIVEAATVHGPIDGEAAQWLISYTGKSWTNIVKGLIQEATDWTNGDLPFVLPDDVAGTHDKTYQGFDLASVGQRLRELTALEGGPELLFDPQLTADRQGLEVMVRVGEPELAAGRVLKLNAGAKDSPVSNLIINEDGSDIAGLGWGTGGRQDDETVLTKVFDTWLTDHGYPLLEMVDNAHTTANSADTLADYVSAALMRARTAAETWSLKLRRDRPLVGTYREADNVLVKMKDDPYVPDGEYAHKIVSLSGSNDSDFVDVGLRTRGV